jgi:hypothetical protein
MGVVKFHVSAVRPALLAGIVEVWGHSGFWPLRKPVNFRVGGNCDAIRIEGRKLLVLVGRRTIAQAKYAPRPERARAGGDPKWENLLQPQDRHGR